MIPELSWAPQRAVFIRRTAINATITCAVLVALGALLSVLLGLTYLWVVPTAVLITAGFLFDDALRWRGSKYDRWHLQAGHLVYESGEGTAQVPLADIDRVFTRMGGRVVIELSSGQRIAMGNLPFPGKTAAAIDAARRGEIGG
ncbi:hypothetical protein BOO69_03505 [Sulfitobacter alexandrii]|uniref:PH domain-containing protein n=1 Tax=Sulfitobacter alexandrii TaxID=1917485 RepID=A0A1J0WE44_9RHOB|nr:hypothetical protein [Sulfitobacter alexandrii]APE42586.1 hypothetical protein BOO69_03505 [Sulfitobacter alexandrii]